MHMAIPAKEHIGTNAVFSVTKYNIAQAADIKAKKQTDVQIIYRSI